MTRALILTALVAAALTAAARAQAPDFSGTWRLDTAASTIVPQANLAGLIPNGAPPTLHIIQPANGTVMVESQINEGHSRIYNPRPSRTTTTPIGQGGSITMTTTRAGATLTSTGVAQAPNGTTTNVKEVYAVSADGQTLTVQVTTTAGEQSHASTMVYKRISSVGGCESWPTPCKRPKQ